MRLRLERERERGRERESESERARGRARERERARAKGGREGGESRRESAKGEKTKEAKRLTLNSPVEDEKNLSKK